MMRPRMNILNLGIMLTVFSCGSSPSQSSDMKSTILPSEDRQNQNRETATFGAGCFWCVEAPFLQIKGVEEVVSGYMGGTVPHPTYEQVCTGETGHAEVCQITYDPDQISYTELLEIFWTIHDPTQLNRQGQDIGTQYRSAVFFHDNTQKQLAESYKEKLNQANAYDAPIVTEISPVSTFYKAEDYHQNYYNENPNQPFCRLVVRPKVEKVKEVFKDKLK